ncbi:glutaminase [Gordonia sp. w5E2]|uniref:Glutaminase n=1 Tax=Gordonia jacobaea TaxID=122202 RepID=A0ABR5I955_9ACTN|nr:MULTISPECIES: glutaminase [Gordonia]KNA90111.1 glutaminase [Gordonia jacobaea]OBC08651.1 glutaminase A [Gordonia sp. 852002-50395_SCH5434458]OBC10395.1 glutaminase A [Gordonia sp. 852002-50816_SCH5313054-a]OBC20273.1 glutaminase A [Gordonia sp. 852002-50816_SCH5313054-c]
MQSPVRDYLTEVLDSLDAERGGAVADYIPDLAEANPDLFAIAVTTVDGRTYCVGDDEVEFSIQSISKPLAYAAALADRGFDTVLEKVGVEPSGEAFNELSLESGTCRPRNPMINAGAITTHGLLVDDDADVESRVERARSFFSTLAGRELTVDQALHKSEMDSADRNLAIAHMLRNYGIVDDAPHDIVDGYIQQCSIMVTAKDLAVIGACFANGGVHPVTGERVMSRRIARQVMSVMAGCGMYDGAGEWLTTVGIPAKSGVAGGLLGTLPGQCGIAVFSPRLDEHGNSTRGVLTFRRLSTDMNMHMVDAEPYGTTVLRDVRTSDDSTTFELQGVIQFSGAEYVLDNLAADETGTPTVVFDVSQVSHFADVGRRMILEGMRRVREDGRRVVLIDPDDTLPDPDLGDGSYPDRS